jgi:hypothetical protein
VIRVPRVNRADMEQRMQEVRTLLAAFTPVPQIKAWLFKQYHVKDRQAQRYIRKVFEEWKARRAGEEDAESDVEIEAAMRLAIAGAIEDRKWNHALYGLRIFAQFKGKDMGATAPATGGGDLHLHQHLHAGELPIEELGPAEKRAELERLLHKKAAAESLPQLPAAPKKRRAIP